MLLYKDIVKEDKLLLREKSSDVTFPLSDEDFQTLSDLNDYLVNGYDEEFVKSHDIRPGVGIAAPQIGVLKKMFAIMAYDEEENFHHYLVCNPRIISESEEKTYLSSGEGCLSVDRTVEGYIHRAKRIKVKGYFFNFETNDFELKELRLQGYIAIVFQHEYDHLFGTLFVDKIDKANPFFVPVNSSPVKFKSSN